MMEENKNEMEEISTDAVEENIIPQEVLDNILEDVPKEHRKTVEQFMIASSVQMGRLSSPETNVMKKISSEHITEYLQAAREDMQKSYEEKKHKKIFTFITLVCAMIFFIIIILILKDSPDVMEKIIYALLGLVAGAFGGYGVGKNKSDE